MTWSYSGDPASSDKDAVRFLIGDTDASDQLATDEEINYALTEGGSIYVSAAIVCESIAAKFARDVDTKLGKASESCSQRVEQFRNRAAELRRLAGVNVLPVFGGESVSEKEELDSDSDAVQPAFKRGMTDSPLVSNPDDWES